MPVKPRTWALVARRDRKRPAGASSAKTRTAGQSSVAGKVTCTPDDNTIQEAHELMAEARAWFLENDRARAELLKMADEDCGAGLRFSVRGAFERLRRKDWSDGHGHPTRFNNSFVPAVTRLVLAERPQYAHLIETRRSILDVLNEHEVDDES